MGLSEELSILSILRSLDIPIAFLLRMPAVKQQRNRSQEIDPMIQTMKGVIISKIV